MVFGITNNSAASQFYQSLISGCKAHKVGHWWLFQNYQKGLENKLHFIPLRICQDDGDVKQCWSKQSPVSWNTWWESNCSCIYNWSAFLEQYFTRVLNIKRYHHFQFSKDEPGKVYFKEFNWSAEQSLMLLIRTVLNCPEGLSQEQKRYLYKEKTWKGGSCYISTINLPYPFELIKIVLL